VPHADNTNWISLLVGQPVPRTDIWSVEEIPAVRAGWDLTHLNTNTPDLERLVEHHVLGSPGGRELTAEVYVPRGAGPFPVLVYAHGGGWCFGSAAGVRRPVTRLAEAGFLTININYALAPEQPFPAAVEDMVFALRWADAHAAELGGDPRRLLAGGDSAGANLAAAAAHVLHGDPTAVDAHGFEPEAMRLSGLVLLFGLFDWQRAILEPGSHSDGSMEVVFNQGYLGPHFLSRHRDPLASPLLSPHLAAFPPCYLSVGDQDSILDQSLAMTRALTAHNVPTTLSVVAGVDHTFTYVEHVIPELVTPEVERILDWMKRTTASLVTA
jgi:acetyl esterase